MIATSKSVGNAVLLNALGYGLACILSIKEKKISAWTMIIARVREDDGHHMTPQAFGLIHFIEMECLGLFKPPPYRPLLTTPDSHYRLYQVPPRNLNSTNY